ncbi:MAG: prephenate dehydrogenase [Candidatus Aminicenantes bacterium]
MMEKMEELIICVVGVGQIGGSFALALRENGIGKKIIGVDKKEVVLNSNIKEIADHVTHDLEGAVKEADFIFLSTPVLSILELLPKIIVCMKPGAILLDSGSTKRKICVAMRKHPEKILIGGHPMAGTEKAGFEAASPRLFQKKIFALCFPTQKSQEGKPMVFKILEEIGASPYEIDEEKHDDLVSMTSHLPYVLSLSLSVLARDFTRKDSLWKDLTATGFLGAARLSLTHEEMGAGILSTNSSRIINIMDEFTQRLKRIKKLIKQGRREELLDFLRSIRNFQSTINEKHENSS